MQNTSTGELAILVAGLRNPDKSFRAGCIPKIVSFGDVAVEFLLPLLQDDNWKVRYRAAEALGMIPGTQAVPFLIDACRDEKDHVRYMAAKSLGQLQASDAGSTLIQLLNDDHPYTRGIAAQGLGMIRIPEAHKAIETAMTNEQDQKIREKMMEILSLLS